MAALRRSLLPMPAVDSARRHRVVFSGFILFKHLSYLLDKLFRQGAIVGGAGNFRPHQVVRTVGRAVRPRFPRRILAPFFVFFQAAYPYFSVGRYTAMQTVPCKQGFKSRSLRLCQSYFHCVNMLFANSCQYCKIWQGYLRGSPNGTITPFLGVSSCASTSAPLMMICASSALISGGKASMSYILPSVHLTNNCNISITCAVLKKGTRQVLPSAYFDISHRPQINMQVFFPGYFKKTAGVPRFRALRFLVGCAISAYSDISHRPQLVAPRHRSLPPYASRSALELFGKSKTILCLSA